MGRKNLSAALTLEDHSQPISEREKAEIKAYKFFFAFQQFD